MSFSRCLLSSALLAGVAFSVLTLPLAVMGSKPVTVYMEEKPVFAGQFKDLSEPYLSAATALSLGVGAVSLALSGWRVSSRKLELTEQKMSTLKQQLQEKEALLESLKFSETRLATSGLEGFLEGGMPVYDRLPAPSASKVNSTNYAIINTPPEAVTTAINPQTKIQAAAAMPSAQAFMGYARSSSVDQSPSETDQEPKETAQYHELLSNLKQVMTQIEKLQQTTPANGSGNWQQHMAS
ncbi:MAG: hypothetical protein HC769_25575 [Cyanobacteria bacterium CRU_2_1]|nr:hypothetical protein [Cyanobacteria bacterium RU_5_0]NJR61903.1 hypothetical protein [Cyanobacteria bacterium CRU_2_1]